MLRDEEGSGKFEILADRVIETSFDELEAVMEPANDGHPGKVSGVYATADSTERRVEDPGLAGLVDVLTPHYEESGEGERAELDLEDLSVRLDNPYVASSLVPPAPRAFPWGKVLLGAGALLVAGTAGAAVVAFQAQQPTLGEKQVPQPAVALTPAATPASSIPAQPIVAIEPEAVPLGAPLAQDEPTPSLLVANGAVTESAAETEPESVAVTESAAESEPEPEPESAAESEPEPEPVAVAVTESAAEPVAEPEVVAEPVAEPDVVAESEPVAVAETEADEPVTEPEPAAQPAPVAVASAVAPSNEQPASAADAVDEALALSAAPAAPATQQAPAAEPAAPAIPATPSREQVAAAFESARPALQECAGEMHGIAKIDVTVLGSGRVSQALIDGVFKGTPQGSCMARAMRKVRFPSFSDPKLSVRIPVSL
ncbi:MAG: hypothetical protein PVI30_09115 [Myxococcales bacterium]